MEMIPSFHETLLMPLVDGSQIGEARRRITALALELGFDETQRGRIAIVASELATNVILHAKTGYLLVRRLVGVGGLEILGVDRGKGMDNVDQCMRDGYSTAGTAGNGLGAIRRLSDHFDLCSWPDKGTVVMARFLHKSVSIPARFLIGAVCVALHGETACGDSWSIHTTASGCLRVVVIDGLGHGAEAAKASCQALQLVEENLDKSTTQTLELVHRGIATTVGAAMAVCDINITSKTTRFAGIGNISGVVTTNQIQRSMVSHNGIIGFRLRKTQEFTDAWNESSILVMHSDGLGTRWSFDEMPGLLGRDPALIAAILHRDFDRGVDDCCVLVVKNNT
jgi:anti-sigma regulatory factor (Ser/Thr protein kinase)